MDKRTIDLLPFFVCVRAVKVERYPVLKSILKYRKHMETLARLDVPFYIKGYEKNYPGPSPLPL